MEPFKNIFNKKSLKKFAQHIEESAGPKFNSLSFQRTINKNLEDLELKERVRLISYNLKTHLPFTYKKVIKILIKTLAPESKDYDDDNKRGVSGFMTWPLLQFVEDYGLEDFDTSFKAMYQMTKRFSAEFAIRPYLKKDDKSVFAILESWKKDPNKHIRRLCSEGTRPNLPWGQKVENINKNLKRNIKLINSLKDDPEEYVRRSVANHLNDISRLDEQLMLETVSSWNTKKLSKNLRWIIRHATRSLLKQGNPRALILHGYNPKLKVLTDNIKINKKTIKEGENLILSFDIKNKSDDNEKILIEYVIHYLKSNGGYSKKPFRLKDGYLKAGETIILQKKIKFKKVTTRRHYAGKHMISLQINGVEGNQLFFNLSL